MESLDREPRPPAGDRRTYIRRSTVRYGVPLGLAVSGWTIARNAASLEHLRTGMGWVRLAVLLLLGLGVWTVGAGWLIGQALWYLHQRFDDNRIAR